MNRRGQVIDDQRHDAPSAETAVQVAELHSHLLHRCDLSGTDPAPAVAIGASGKSGATTAVATNAEPSSRAAVQPG